jgi:hypothetical protein
MAVVLSAMRHMYDKHRYFYVPCSLSRILGLAQRKLCHGHKHAIFFTWHTSSFTLVSMYWESQVAFAKNKWRLSYCISLLTALQHEISPQSSPQSTTQSLLSPYLVKVIYRGCIWKLMSCPTHTWLSWSQIGSVDINRWLLTSTEVQKMSPNKGNNAQERP